MAKAVLHLSNGAVLPHGAYKVPTCQFKKAKGHPERWPKCLVSLVAHQGLEPRTCGL
jgi:hypothetical protein